MNERCLEISVSLLLTSFHHEDDILVFVFTTGGRTTKQFFIFNATNNDVTGLLSVTMTGMTVCIVCRVLCYLLAKMEFSFLNYDKVIDDYWVLIHS